MTKTATKKDATNGRKAPAAGTVPATNGFEHSYTQMALSQIVPSRFEPQARRRARFTIDEISELADSIKANGLIQPITVRPIEHGEFHYEIVCGERRFLAVKKAGLDTIDVVVRNLSDAAALDVQITENLQRKDVDPIDEAFSFKYLLDLGKYTIHDLAALLGRTEKFIRQRLRLNELIPEILELVARGILPLGHAMEIAKYPAAAQRQIHERELAFSWIDHAEGDEEPEYEIAHFAEFKSDLRRLSLKLSEATFDIADGSLHPEGRACGSCPERTGFEPLLFEDELKDGDACLNSSCFHQKVLVHITRNREAAAATLKNPKKLPIEEMLKKVPFVSNGYFYRSSNGYFYRSGIVPDGEKVLDRQKFLDDAECSYATPAIIADGERQGQQTYICNNGHCKKHKAEESKQQPAAPNKWELENKEREFQVKVANKVRERIFVESMSTFDERAFWSDKEFLVDVVVNAWSNDFHSKHQIIDPVIKEWDEKAPVGSNSREKLAKFVRGLDESKLSQLLFLAVYAHRGFSGWSLVDQSGVKAVNDRYAKLNHKLIDAEARVELAPKEFKSQAKTYLKAVQSGEDVPVPHFWHEEKKK